MIKNLKRIRKTHNMTQTDLAEKASLALPTISKFERGRAIPTQRTLEKLARAFSLSVADFMNALDDDTLYTPPPPEKVDVGRGLWGYRKSKGIPQRLVADTTGLSQPTISNIEQGKHHPNLSTAAILANFYGLSIEDFYQLLDMGEPPVVCCGKCKFWNQVEGTPDGRCLEGTAYYVEDRRKFFPLTSKDQMCGKGRLI